MRAAIGAALSALGVVAVAVHHGFRAPLLPAVVLTVAQVALSWVALVVSADVAWRTLGWRRWTTKVGLAGEMAAVVVAVLEVVGVAWAGEALAVATLITLVLRLNGRLARSMRNPSLLFPGSFFLLIAASTCLLKLPAATPEQQPISWVDAAFTSTSAVCVTGLAVRDTASGFTPFGQGVILGSIQLGGLGVMIFGSTLALLFGARLSLRENLTLSMALDEYPAHRITRFVWFIVLTTFVLETIGAGVIYLLWPEDAAAGGRAWRAIFHSVSAFCNAGFDVTGQSMIGVRWSPVAFLGVAPMIIVGGLGFGVLEDLYSRWLRPRRAGTRRPRLSTHSKIVLSTTGALLVLGSAGLFLMQMQSGGHGLGRRALDAMFMATTARTAGFTTVPMAELSSGSVFLLMLLMAVGGSPGSTAGGMKTSVLAVLVLAVISTVRRRDEVEAFGRSLPETLVRRAATLAFGLVAVIATATLALDLTETLDFRALLFEAVSAATTTGLSLDATPRLSDPGRVVIIVTMFLGRVGPLAVLASLTSVRDAGGSGAYRFPRDSVSLG